MKEFKTIAELINSVKNEGTTEARLSVKKEREHQPTDSNYPTPSMPETIPEFYKLLDFLAINKTLTYLDISNNKIHDNEARDIAASLKTNTTLTSLDLSGNEITYWGLDYLTEALEKNTTITWLNIKYPENIVEPASPTTSDGSTTNYKELFNVKIESLNNLITRNKTLRSPETDANKLKYQQNAAAGIFQQAAENLDIYLPKDTAKHIASFTANFEKINQQRLSETCKTAKARTNGDFTSLITKQEESNNPRKNWTSFVNNQNNNSNTEHGYRYCTIL